MTDLRPPPGPERHDPSRRAGLWLATIVIAAAPAYARAQEPSATIEGVVRDATGGGPVESATVVVEDQGRLVYSDSTGAFRLANLALGAALLRVRALGYEEMLVPVTAGAGTVPVEIRLAPSPIVLEGIEVTGEAPPASVSGVVLDAASGEGITWSSLWLRDVRRFSTDDRGVFRLSGVEPGSYLLLAERMGYESLWVPVRVASPAEPVVVRLRPDPVLLEGIRVLTRRIDSRRNAYAAGPVRAYDEGRLRRSGAPDVQTFLQQEAFLSFEICTVTGDLCVGGRGGPTEPRVFIDELYVPCGLEVLRSYQPSQLYSLDVFDGGKVIRVYTPDFMERRARRPRQMIPADVPSPLLGC